MTSCLEANRVDPDSVLKGAAFMDRCQFVSGQAWMAQPVGNGRFTLLSQLHGDDRCLAVNAGAVDAIDTGTPYMGPCATDGAQFEAVPRDSEREGPFQLVVRFEGRDVCLANGPGGGSEQRAVSVQVAECATRDDQLWTLANGGLVDGIPTADGTGAIAKSAANATGQTAECLWNDGTGDRPEYYDCTVERLDRNGSFVVKGDDRLHEFVVQFDRPDEAYGFQVIAGDTIRLGRFRRRVEDPACWLNSETGERLCIW